MRWSELDVSLGLVVAPAGAWPAKLVGVAQPAMRRVPARRPPEQVRGSQGRHVAGRRCTTRFEHAHRTVRREVLYRHHPWFGRQVCAHAAIEKADGFVFRCTLDGSEAERWLEIPAWMLERSECPDGLALTVEPFVSLDALNALSALLDLALKDRASSSNAPLSGACGTSHDQNRG